jgi:D-serine deaminase-like pyridoxal phosphate-dependent protein
MKKHEIPTPAMVVDLDKLRRNIDEMADRAREAGMDLRPHIKTHKTPIISHMQVRAGAVGITCAKLGEAEVMAAAGIEDIFLAYPIVGPDKVERLLNLARWIPKISTAVDTLEAARALSDAAVERGQRIDVLVDVECGYKRTGVTLGEPLVELTRAIVGSMPGLRYVGLMVMAGYVYKELDPDKQLAAERRGAKYATDGAELLRSKGIESEIISVGSTPGAKYMHQVEGVTEYRPGAYVFGDVINADLGAHTLDEMALTVLTSVVSVPAPTHFIVDAGTKALTNAASKTTPGRGPLVQMPGLAVSWLCEEHGMVDLTSGTAPPPLGAKLDILPNYVSDVVNLGDKLWVVQGDDVVGEWDILARGKRV